MGYRNRGSVYAIIKQAQSKQIAEGVEYHRDVELVRLNSLQSELWDKAMAGNVSAVHECLKLVIARCRLLGLYEERRETSPKDRWDNCQGPPTVIARADDCRHDRLQKARTVRIDRNAGACSESLTVQAPPLKARCNALAAASLWIHAQVRNVFVPAVAVLGSGPTSAAGVLMLDPVELFNDVFVDDGPADVGLPEWFPATPPDFPADLDDWLTPVGIRSGRNRPEEDDGTIEDLGEQLNDLHDDEAVRGVIRDIGRGGIHAIAVYVPYCVDRRRWGVYFHELGMAAVTVSAAWELATVGKGHYPLQRVARAVWHTVFSHELVHFGLEYAGATFEAATTSGLYRAAVGPGAFRDLQESIATAVEMSAAETRSSERADVKFRHDFADAWGRLPLPHPYNQWPSYAQPAALEGGFRMTSHDVV